MIKPKKLKKGDTIAIVSPSSGLAGEHNIRWRTEEGMRRIEQMGYRVKVMPNALKSIQWNYEHPKARAESLMAAFQDDSVQAILCTIGGNESVRIIPFLEAETIKQNPKIFIGYSDITALHLYLNSLGLTTFYGPAVLTDFAENGGNDDYTMASLFNLIQNPTAFGEIKTAPYMRKCGLRWDEHLRQFEREKLAYDDFHLLNGKGEVSGPLLGGCFESLDKLRGTPYFPEIDSFCDAILFIETSEVHIPAWSFEESLRAWGLMGIFERVRGIIVGRPQDGVFKEDYDQALKKILEEFNYTDLIVMTNVCFGHNEPKATLPYGVQVTLQTHPCQIHIDESAVR
ncbi:S66 peptidase family protein [Staphylococcus ratti]|uniref:LD-carboxypeptidase n=1 Tax=Staphylococcus ratti TaxID=2892440 RepID=A0ABY3PAH0_9STAP|nr:S66 peptidase family protein [Staphylococcus ratti]UEX89279.1 LD-carboxypeptidase [Staphylococcus ratti]